MLGKRRVKQKVRVYRSATQMRLGIALWTRRGWRVQSQSGKFNLWFPTIGSDGVTVVFEKVQETAEDGKEPELRADESTKTCPDCAETVKLAANVCRFCGYRFDGGGAA